MAVTKYEGSTYLENAKVAIVVARWNSAVTEKMLEGALEALKGNGIAEEDITVTRCPGSFELPLAVQFLLEEKQYDGIVALGAVIRGGTPHFDYVCEAVTSGIATLNLKYNIPVAFGVLTTDNVKQALERVGEKGNKGSEAALAALEMISLAKKIKQK